MFDVDQKWKMKLKTAFDRISFSIDLTTKLKINIIKREM